jgi:hypothetical protein
MRYAKIFRSFETRLRSDEAGVSRNPTLHNLMLAARPRSFLTRACLPLRGCRVQSRFASKRNPMRVLACLEPGGGVAKHAGAGLELLPYSHASRTKGRRLLRRLHG